MRNSVIIPFPLFTTFLHLLLFFTSFTYGQSGIGTKTPDPSAALEVQSTSKRVLPPKLTTAQRTAIVSPATGLLIYNTDINCLENFNGSTWVNMCCGIPGETALVSGAAGKTWMTYNLGATAPAASASDYTQYGSLYQWGRGSDGHQLINWTGPTSGTPVNGTSSTLASNDNPGHSLFIYAPNFPYDWRSPQNNALWQGRDGINNPCPIGFRIPTDAEWTAEFTAAGIIDMATAYSSCLKLVAPGYRMNHYSGSIYSPGGYYWTSTISGNSVKQRSFDSTRTNSYDFNRALGLSVRCIKD